MPTIASRHRPAPTRVVLGLLALLAGPGCAAGNWGQDRVRDLADVVDVRYGTGIGLGLGLQVGDIFQTGLGCSIEWYQRQWFGRKSVEVENGLFASGLLITFDGDYWRRPGPDDWIHAGNSTSGSFSQ
ncbi:MAG TPA: hypothetical protein VFD43_02825, partial [Planctomycetota bacterium]|nr:hypothetical protein [Planctomycetota bacterium]